MKLNAENITMAPAAGTALLYFQSGVWYGEYGRSGSTLTFNQEETFPESKLLEAHLFNQEKEYRYIWSDERNGYLEAEITDEKLHAGQDCSEGVMAYCEDIFLLDGFGGGKLTVISYMMFDEDDMLRLINYRLSTSLQREVADYER